MRPSGGATWNIFTVSRTHRWKNSNCELVRLLSAWLPHANPCLIIKWENGNKTKRSPLCVWLILECREFEETGLVSAKTQKWFWYKSRLWLVQPQSDWSSGYGITVAHSMAANTKRILQSGWSLMENFQKLICDGTSSSKRVEDAFLHSPNSQRSMWQDEIKQEYSLRGIDFLERECFFRDLFIAEDVNIDCLKWGRMLHFDGRAIKLHFVWLAATTGA